MLCVQHVPRTQSSTHLSQLAPKLQLPKSHKTRNWANQSKNSRNSMLQSAIASNLGLQAHTHTHPKSIIITHRECSEKIALLLLHAAVGVVEVV